MPTFLEIYETSATFSGRDTHKKHVNTLSYSVIVCCMLYMSGLHSVLLSYHCEANPTGECLQVYCAWLKAFQWDDASGPSQPLSNTAQWTWQAISHVQQKILYQGHWIMWMRCSPGKHTDITRRGWVEWICCKMDDRQTALEYNFTDWWSQAQQRVGSRQQNTAAEGQTYR